jgi:alpha-tubulin suppressor-like RCC1 family protein
VKTKALSASFFLLAAGCLGVPPGAQLLCESDADCPGAHTCNTNIGRCISPDDAEDVPPSVTDVSVEPSLASPGTRVTIGFTASEALFSAPSVALRGEGPLEDASLPVPSLGDGEDERPPGSLRWTYEIVVPSDVPDGTAAITATLVDVVGNLAVIDLGAVIFDATAPNVAEPVWLPPAAGKSAAQPSETWRLEVDTEPDARVLAATLRDSLGRLDVDLTDAFDVDDEGLAAGDVDLSAHGAAHADVLIVALELADEAGNAVEVLSAPLTVDGQAPTAPSIDVVPTLTATVEVDLLIAVEGAREMFIDGDVLNDDSTQEWVELASGATVTLSAGDGVKTISARFRDEAYNESAVVSDTVELTLGAVRSRPTLTLPVGQTALKNGDALIVAGAATSGSTLVSARLVDGAGATVQDVASLVSVASDGALSGSFVTVGLVDGSSVQLEIVVEADGLTSAAVDSRTLPVPVDLTPPVAPDPARITVIESSSAPVDPDSIAESFSTWSLAGVAGSVAGARRLRVYSDAALEQRLDLVQGGATVTEAAVDESGAIAASELPYNGALPYQLVAVDDAGNESPPIVALVPRFSAVSWSPEIPRAGITTTIDFISSTDLAAPPIVTLSAREATLVQQSGTAWRYEVVLDGTEAEGVDAAVLRIAGDESPSGFATLRGTDAVKLSLDFTAPDVDVAAVVVGESAPGTSDDVVGQPTAVRDLAGTDDVTVLWPPRVYVIALDDTELAALDVAADGSVPSVDLGDNVHAQVRYVVEDRAGNRTELLLNNDIAPPVVASLVADPPAQQSGAAVQIRFDVTDDHDLSAAPTVGLTGGRAFGLVSGDIATSDQVAHPFVYELLVDSGQDAEQSHTVALQLTDAVGNVATAQVALDLDYTAPDTHVVVPGTVGTWNGATGISGDAVDALSGVDRVELTLEDVAAGLFFDGAGFTSATEVALTAAGTDTFSYATSVPVVEGRSYRLRATAIDAAGHRDASPFEQTYVADLTLPDTQIVTAPAANVETLDAAFAFACTTGPPCTYRCSLDGAAFGACDAATSYADLATGSHALEVIAIDEAGNVDPTPARHEWMILRTWLDFSVGLTHACAISQDRALWCWGGDDEPGFGAAPTVTYSFRPTRIGADRDWAEVVASDTRTFARRTDGSLWSWGQRYDGRLGLGGGSTTVTAPTRVGSDTDWAKLGRATGWNHACAIKSDDSVWCWGKNYSGEVSVLGNYSPGEVISSPRAIGVDPNAFASVVTGEKGTFVLGGDGSVRWGGECQDSACNIGNTQGWAHLSLGGNLSCGVRTDRSLWCWGANQYGGAGVDPQVENPVPSATRIGVANDWDRVEAYYLFACATNTSGAAYCWGRNNLGSLGTGDAKAPDSYDPVAVAGGLAFDRIDVGGDFACGLTSDALLYCWGDNRTGALGVGVGDILTPVAQAGPTDAAAIARYHGCRITSGQLWCWGDNGSGRLGDGTIVDRHQPVRIGLDEDWRDVTVGLDHTCATRTDRSLWCWGNNNLGKLGLGNAGPGTERLAPERVGLDTDWDALSATEYGTCATRVDNTLWCWGADSVAGLGQGAGALTPTQVGADTDWGALSGGDAHTCGVKRDGAGSGGSLYCWGVQNNGELGTGVKSSVEYAPTRVGTDTTWTSVSTGLWTTCGVQESGALWCWGANFANGWLGVGDTTSYFATPQAVGTGETWVDVANGYFGACALNDSAEMFCWGDNTRGEVGDGTTQSRLSPTLSHAGSWSQLVAGGTRCAIDGDGALSCWGGDPLARGDDSVLRASPTLVLRE